MASKVTQEFSRDRERAAQGRGAGGGGGGKVKGKGKGMPPFGGSGGNGGSSRYGPTRDHSNGQSSAPYARTDTRPPVHKHLHTGACVATCLKYSTCKFGDSCFKIDSHGVCGFKNPDGSMCTKKCTESHNFDSHLAEQEGTRGKSGKGGKNKGKGGQPPLPTGIKF